MVTVENDILILDRTDGTEDILPLLHVDKSGKSGGWYIDIAVQSEEVKNLLLDAEVLAEDIPIHYTAANGAQFDALAKIEELISGPEENLCRLKGKGKPPAAFLADGPKEI